MSHSRKSNAKRQELSPGVILEKYQIKKKKKLFYIFKIEVQIFNVLEFTVDFTGSENIELKYNDTLIEQTYVQPFTKTVVATVLLKKHWSLKTKFRFNPQLPSLELQKKHLNHINDEIKYDIEIFSELKYKNMIISDEEKIKEFCNQKSKEFYDPEFPPDYSSIGITEKEFIDLHECLVHWRRLRFIFLKSNELSEHKMLPYIFKDQIKADTIKQGKFENSWLLSGFATLAEKPALIKRLILTKKPNEYGMYKIKLLDFGAWKNIMIDEFFPCFPLADPIFNHNSQKEIWVLLLEKAFAKLHGNYAKLNIGNPKESLFALTGCPVFEIFTYEQVKDKNYDQLWNNIEKWMKYEYLISCSTKEIDQDGSFNGLSFEQTYSLLRIYDDGKLRLMNLRNLWGVFDWNGDWSSESKLWNEQLIDKIRPNLEDESSFWISIEHFIENFERIYVCYTRSWNELKVRGKFVKTVDEDNPKFVHWCSRWYYQITLEKKTKVIIGIHQENERTVGVVNTRRYIDIGLDIIQLEEEEYKLVDFLESDIH